MTTSGKKKLILIPSRSMDNNRKEGRNEASLVRMAAKTRSFMDFKEDKLEVWTVAGQEREASVMLDIFQAFSADVKKIKDLVRQGEMKPGELNRVGFVTTKMYNRITGGDKDKNIWVSTGVHDTVIGADPEFLLFNEDGEVVHANGVMNKSGIIGCDGAMAEVRPGPSTSPDGVVKNIQSAFADKSLTSAISSYEWRAGCYFKNSKRDYPMGGHIHVGNPAKVAQMPMPKRELFFNVLNKIMDEMLTIPCNRLDGDMGRKRRTDCQMSMGSSGWGWFGEWRTCNGRLEHRSLSGMWLIHPSVAKCVLGSAKAITDEVFKLWSNHGFKYDYVVPMKHNGLNRSDMNHDSFTEWKSFQVCRDIDAKASSKDVRLMMANSKGGDITKAYLDKWHAKMKRLSTYGKYSKYIDGLRKILLLSMNDISNWDRNIQNNWLKSKKFLVDV
jgi:hypothetical protein